MVVTGEAVDMEKTRVVTGVVADMEGIIVATGEAWIVVVKVEDDMHFPDKNEHSNNNNEW